MTNTIDRNLMLVFDGHGINDLSNEYHNRLATLTQAGKDAGIGPLLAAAPELLEACKEVIKRLIEVNGPLSNQDNGRIKSSITTLSQAIAKAEGR